MLGAIINTLHCMKMPNLNSEEQELFQFVRADNINTIRLEQEKISQEFVLKQIAKIYEPV